MSCNLNKKLATKSAEIIQTEDLLVEIFLRLPLHSVQRFKIACKHWQSLLINPNFRKQWSKRNLKPATGLILRIWGPLSTQFVPFSSDKPITLPHLRTELKIIQSCNGLLLCSNKKMYHVYNPTTGMCHTLPELGDRDVINSMSLDFDPKKSPYYKVICFVKSGYYALRVYSSDTHSWKSVSKSMSGKVNDRGVYWNGAIHWICALSYFDIETEMFNSIPHPHTNGNWRMDFYFGESFGSLNYARIRKPMSGDSFSVDVYELKKDYSEWVLKYRADLDYRWCFDTSVLSVVHGVEDDDSFLVLKIGDVIVRYNLVSKTSVELHVLSPYTYVDSAFQYIESLCDV